MAKKQLQKVLGLMSGTSADGADVALIATDGEDAIEFFGGLTLPYDRELRARVLEASQHDVPLLELARDQFAGTVLVEAEFGMAVHVPAQLDEFVRFRTQGGKQVGHRQAFNWGSRGSALPVPRKLRRDRSDARYGNIGCPMHCSSRIHSKGA